MDNRASRNADNIKLLINAALLFYAAVLIALNLARMFDYNFWGDEAFSLRLAKMSFGDMFQATARDVHPPLYYMGLILMYRAFGDHAWVYHFTSVIPYIALVICGLTLVRRHFGTAAAALFITLISISRPSVKYNVEVRMYSLAALFVFINFWGFFMILRKQKFGPLVFVVGGLGAAYSHYYGLFAVAILYAALLLFVIFKKFKLGTLIAVYAVTIVSYLPWLFQMLTTFKRTSEGFWMTSVPTVAESLKFYYESPSRKYSWGMLGITLLFALIAVIIDLVKRRSAGSGEELSEKTSRLSPETVLVVWGLVMAFGTLGIGQLISILIRPAFTTRYLFPVLPVLWLCLCIAVSKIKFREIILVALIAVSLVLYVPDYVRVYKSDNAKAEQCDRTWSSMQGLLEDEDVLLTDRVHLNWTILELYFPENPRKLIYAGFSDWDSSKNYWLLWTDALTEEENAWLAGEGYAAEEVLTDCQLGLNNFILYKLSLENEKEG